MFYESCKEKNGGCANAHTQVFFSVVNLIHELVDSQMVICVYLDNIVIIMSLKLEGTDRITSYLLSIYYHDTY